MTKYRKKPVIIEAKQATGTPVSNREIIDWTRDSSTPAFMDTEIRNCSADHPDGFDYPVLKINTLEGAMTVKTGDWIIKGVKGEFYPCKPDIFAATYDAETLANGMNFGQALEAIKAGQRIARTGWNGKGMFAYLVPPASYPVQTGAAKEHFGEGAMVPYNAYMAIKNVDETVSTWVPSVNDCLADDWGIVGDAAPASSHPPHQQRVLDEKRDLDDKLHRLTAFISSEKFSTIVQDEAERGRLVCQEEAMKDYSAILAERIANF